MTNIDGDESHNNFDFVIGEPTFIPVFESQIPRNITDSILAHEEIPPVPELGSSITEDFIVKQLKLVMQLLMVLWQIILQKIYLLRLLN